LKFNRVLEVVEVDVRTTFQQAECSGSRVILGTEKKLQTNTFNTIQSVTTMWTVTKHI